MCPPGEPAVYVLSLTYPTGEWQPPTHGPGAYEELRFFSVTLPEMPRGAVRYSAEQLRLSENNKAIPIHGGFVEIDLVEGVAIVALEGVDGPFVGNWTYPLMRSNKSLERTRAE